MRKIKALLVTSSPRATSGSAGVAREALAAAGIEEAEWLDTVQSPPPAYGKDLMDAVFGASEEPGALRAKEASDDYIAQVARADVLVVAIPVHNFGVPSGFKAWMDQLARPGVTFKQGPSDRDGALSGKRALVILASGGDHRGRADGHDHAGSHARAFFAFLGMQAEVVHVPSQAGARSERERAAAVAEATVILRGWLAQA